MDFIEYICSMWIPYGIHMEYLGRVKYYKGAPKTTYVTTATIPLYKY
jgi:hypothetical protein